MARLVLVREDLKHNELPPVCMQCGMPSTTTVRKQFQWCPGWTLALIIAGLLPYIIVSMVLTKYATVPAPMCHRHRHHWLSRMLFIVIGLLVFIALIVGSAVLKSVEGMGAVLEKLTGAILIISVVGLFAVLLIGGVLQATSIRTTGIDAREITIVKVHPDFVDAYEEELYESGVSDRKRRGRRKSPKRNDMEFCPSCGELIRTGATHCRFCGDKVK